MEGDITPELLLSEDEEIAPPVGDIAELTARVSERASTPGKFADPPTSARTRVFTSQKNKGVGKGCSGSSGPPAKRKVPATSTVSKAPKYDTSSDDDADEELSEDNEDEDQDPTATQTIMVGAKRGYTFYPTYLFDVPPKSLKTDTLRKKLMISEIKRSETQTQFYERGMILMGHLKEFLSHLRMSGFLGEAVASASRKEGDTDHDYAINNEDQEGDDTQN